MLGLRVYAIDPAVSVAADGVEGLRIAQRAGARAPAARTRRWEILVEPLYEANEPARRCPS
jgi:hypothetical protein